MPAGETRNGKIPLMLIQGARRSAPSRGDYADSLTAVSAGVGVTMTSALPMAAAAVEGWLDGALDQSLVATEQSHRRAGCRWTFS
jgi:hypothetical protein